jgi:hypothetical protein
MLLSGNQLTQQHQQSSPTTAACLLLRSVLTKKLLCLQTRKAASAGRQEYRQGHVSCMPALLAAWMP